MALRVVTAPDLQLEWTNPSNARFIACGVFSCNPEIGIREVQNDADESPTGTSLRRITNVDACMLELHVTDTSRTSFPLGTRLARTGICTSDTIHAPVINFVAAGCWAYDTFDIIAASDLVRIAPVDYARVSSAVPTGAACSSDDTQCYDEVRDFFGVCVDNACQPRCTSDEDCEHAAAQLFNQPLDSTCKWQCRDVANSLAGACVPLP